jgi:ankyrin repeat protein
VSYERIFQRVTAHLAMTKFFIEDCGFDANLADSRGYTLLSSIFITRKYNKEITEYLISKGADVNKQIETGDTPLMRCLQKDSLTLEQFQHRQILLKNGASVTIKNNLGIAPIDLDPMIETRYSKDAPADFFDDRSNDLPKVNLMELRQNKKEAETSKE